MKDDQGDLRARADMLRERAQRDLGEGPEMLSPNTLDTGHGEPDGHHPDGHSVSERRASHRGREIVIETHYKITIDGAPLAIHVSVNDEGLVHSHGLPNYAFGSMVDLVRSLIDASGVDLPEDELGQDHGCAEEG